MKFNIHQAINLYIGREVDIGLDREVFINQVMDKKGKVIKENNIIWNVQGKAKPTLEQLKTLWDQQGVDYCKQKIKDKIDFELMDKLNKLNTVKFNYLSNKKISGTGITQEENVFMDNFNSEYVRLTINAENIQSDIDNIQINNDPDNILNYDYKNSIRWTE